MAREAARIIPPTTPPKTQALVATCFRVVSIRTIALSTERRRLSTASSMPQNVAHSVAFRNISGGIEGLGVVGMRGPFEFAEVAIEHNEIVGE